MSDDPSPNFNRVGLGAAGNVTVQHDASNHHHVHHEDKSQHTHIYPPQPPAPQPPPPAAVPSPTEPAPANSLLIWTFGIIVLGAGTILAILYLTGQPQASPLTPTPNPPLAESPSSADTPAEPQLDPKGLTGPPPEPPTPAAPQPLHLIAAEVGQFNVALSQFTPTTTFKTGDLLTLKVKLSHDSYLRVLYQPAIGDPQLLFPEQGDGSVLVPGGRDLFIPDPAKLAAQTADASAFQLFHDFGTGPPLEEQIVIQISPTPISAEGSTSEANMPYRVFSGLRLADARTRGGIRLPAPQALAAQAQADTKHPSLGAELSLTFFIRP